MRFFAKRNDGGPESNVTGYWLIESKRFFSIALLRFSPGSRENYHSHAFNAWSLVFGSLTEIRQPRWGLMPVIRKLSGFVFTERANLHRVINKSTKPVWALTFRGPWHRFWWEYDPRTSEYIKLTTGRHEVARVSLFELEGRCPF